jgi:dienelactone hydrolase
MSGGGTVNHEREGTMTDLGKLKGLGAWQQARHEIEDAVREVLGPLPKSHVEIQIKTVDEMDYPGYTRRRVNYFVDEWTRIAGWLFLPEGRDEVPGILCCHNRVRQGKDEAAGISGDPMLAFAQRYAEMGYAALAPDCITAGERVLSRAQPYESKGYYKDSPKLSLAGKMLSDHMHALDVFSEVKRVDAARIGVIGHGLGAFNALMLSAFDERVQACVASGGFSRLHDDTHPERWYQESETGLALMPALAAHVEKKSYPFDFEHILALAAPTATLVMSPQSGVEGVNAKSVNKAVDQAGKVYKMLSASSALEYHEHDNGDSMNPDMMEVVDEWFDRWI